jgi:ring-1,2-phenylacetyl-CoA epoxidase subunit PaaD
VVTAASLKELLAQIPDPEIPVISIEELGILREVALAEDGAVTVTITPTYNGCPALAAIEDDIRSRLAAAGFEKVRIETVLSPAWSTDWMSEEAKEKLRKYGIAPPEGRLSGIAPPRARHGADTHRITLFSRSVPCPRCGSEATERLSEFGSTACKALYRCLECREPFDYFKPH